MLRLRVRPGEGEPGYALFLRLAARHSDLSAGDFGQIAGLRYEDVLQGRSLAELADANDSSAEELRRWSPRKASGGWTLNGHRLGRGEWRPDRAAYCADCLLTNIEPLPDGITDCHAAVWTGAHRRVWWDLQFVDTCPIHDRLLQRACVCSRPVTPRDALSRWCPTGCDRALQSGTAVGHEMTAPDVYLLGRLGAVPTTRQVSLLDDLPIGVAAEVMTRTGHVLGGGREPMGRLAGAHRCEVRLKGLRLFESCANNQQAIDEVEPELRHRLSSWLGSRVSTRPLKSLREFVAPPKISRVLRRDIGRYQISEAAALTGLDVSAFLGICLSEKCAPVDGLWSDAEVEGLRYVTEPELLLPLPSGGYVPCRDYKPRYPSVRKSNAVATKPRTIRTPFLHANSTKRPTLGSKPDANQTKPGL